MTQVDITIRSARPADATAIADVHDEAWREAYRGIIPGRELEQMIQRRGPVWWRTILDRGARVAVLEIDDELQGYVSYGRNRLAVSPYLGEIFELYLSPEYQGLGFGKRLFKAARRDLDARGLNGLIVWALADNDRACSFYTRLGGIKVREMDETFGAVVCRRHAFGWV